MCRISDISVLLSALVVWFTQLVEYWFPPLFPIHVAGFPLPVQTTYFYRRESIQTQECNLCTVWVTMPVYVCTWNYTLELKKKKSWKTKERHMFNVESACCFVWCWFQKYLANGVIRWPQKNTVVIQWVKSKQGTISAYLQLRPINLKTLSCPRTVKSIIASY